MPAKFSSSVIYQRIAFSGFSAGTVIMVKNSLVCYSVIVMAKWNPNIYEREMGGGKEVSVGVSSHCGVRGRAPTKPANVFSCQYLGSGALICEPAKPLKRMGQRKSRHRLCWLANRDPAAKILARKHKQGQTSEPTRRLATTEKFQNVDCEIKSKLINKNNKKTLVLRCIDLITSRCLG